MAETTTGTAQNTTEAATSNEAAATTLLGTEAQSATETQTTEQKPAVEAPPATETKPAAETPATETKPAETKPEGAPEKYEFKAPEGQAFDPALLTAFEAGAREANLPQAAAQKLLEQMAPKIAERQVEQIATIRNGWMEASKADKEFGGTGLDANLGVAKSALDKFGTPELNQLLVSTGLGNHPEVIRLMYKVGKAVSQDTFVVGSAPSKSTANAVNVLYDNTKKES